MDGYDLRKQLAIENIYKISIFTCDIMDDSDSIDLKTELINYVYETIKPIIMMYDLKFTLNVLENFNKTVNKIAKDTVEEIDKKHFEMILRGSLAEKDLKTIQKLAKKGINAIYIQYVVGVYNNSSEASMPVRMP